MSRPSLESSRPILSSTAAKSRASARLSTYSVTAPSSILTEKSMNSVSTNGDLRTYNIHYDRMENRRLQEQRYVVSSEKDDIMSKLALGAKVQKALDRRYTNQDAVFKPKPKKTVSEKPTS